MARKHAAKDADSDSASWWKKRREQIKADLGKDDSLINELMVLIGRPGAPGAFTLELYHHDFPMPLAVIWFGWVGLDATQINNIYTFEPLRRIGLMTFLQKTMRKWWPKRKLVTGAGTTLGAAFMLKTGWKKTAAGWELR